MSVKAEKKYAGEIMEGAYFYYTSKGSLSFNIPIKCEDGTITFDLWLTDKNKERATKTLEMLGADKDKLSNQNYLEDKLPSMIVGKKISFGTNLETYNGKDTVKVVWIGKPTDPNVARGAASFFGGGSTETPEDISRPIDDNDIPF